MSAFYANLNLHQLNVKKLFLSPANARAKKLGQQLAEFQEVKDDETDEYERRSITADTGDFSRQGAGKVSAPALRVKLLITQSRSQITSSFSLCAWISMRKKV